MVRNDMKTDLREAGLLRLRLMWVDRRVGAPTGQPSRKTIPGATAPSAITPPHEAIEQPCRRPELALGPKVHGNSSGK